MGAVSEEGGEEGVGPLASMGSAGGRGSFFLRGALAIPACSDSSKTCAGGGRALGAQSIEDCAASLSALISAGRVGADNVKLNTLAPEWWVLRKCSSTRRILTLVFR